jgi:hypothetical protein
MLKIKYTPIIPTDSLLSFPKIVFIEKNYFWKFQHSWK